MDDPARVSSPAQPDRTEAKIMREAIDRYWAQYFYSGSIALIVSWVLLITLSGCRFGNHVEEGPTQDIGASGYYSTRPTSYTVSTTQTSGGSHVLNLSVASVPSLLSNNFTDPTTLVMVDSATGRYAAFAPTTGNPSSYQDLFVLANGKSIGISEETGWEQTWTDPACQINTTFDISGSLNALASNDPKTMSTSLGRITLTGRIALKATYKTSFQGNCTSSWQGMADCYQTLASCPGSTTADQLKWQGLAQSTYNFWIQAGALNLNEIATTNELRFDVSYQ
jgi:hypothetical protein